MNSNVVIKSMKNGLKLFLNNDCSFEELKEDIRTKFKESKDFFKGGKIAVSFEGRKLLPEEENELIEIIENCAELSILYVVSEEELTNRSLIKAVERVADSNRSMTLGKIYKGSVKKGEKVDADGSIVILGDVEPGSTVSANGNIIVLGGIYGSVVSECENNSSNTFIYANDISAELLKINNITYFSKEKTHWVVKPKAVPKIGFIKDGIFVCEPVTKASIAKLSTTLGKENV